MAKLGTLIVELATNTSRFVRGIEATNKRLDRFANRARRITQIVGTAFAGISIARLGQEAVEVVDKYTALQGRLRIVAKEGENLADTQERLFQISQKTRNETGATVDLYTRLARSTKDLNVSQDELFQTTELINKAITISGASSASASAALFQLGQGLSAGALRGEELNSVLEQTPRLAQAIADGLGVTIAELRKMGSEGQITSRAVIEGLQNQADTINREFASVPQTVAQSYQLLKNDIENIVKTFNGLANAVKVSIDNIRELTQTLSDFVNREQRAAEATQLFNDYIKGNVIQLKQLGIIEQGVADVSKSSLEDLQRYIKAAENFGVQLQRNVRLTEVTEQIEKYQNQLRSLQTRQDALTGTSEAYATAKQKLSEQIGMTTERIDELIQSYVKLAQAEEEETNKTKQSATEHQKWLAGLVRQEELMRANLSTREAANDELVRTKALYDGNIISLEAYLEKTQKLNETIAQQTQQTQEGFTGPGSSYTSQLEADAEAQAALLEQDREWRQRRVRQAADEKERLEKLDRNKNFSLLNSAASLFGSLASIAGSGSKKQFELSKKLAKAETLVATIASAQQTYYAVIKSTGNVPAATAAAGAAYAAGLARVVAINRTSFDSSAAAAANTGAGAFTPAPQPTPITPGTNAAQGQTFIIIGDGTLSEGQLDEILDRTAQRINEGSQVIIRRDSVQAQEIAAAVA